MLFYNGKIAVITKSRTSEINHWGRCKPSTLGFGRLSGRNMDAHLEVVARCVMDHVGYFPIFPISLVQKGKMFTHTGRSLKGIGEGFSFSDDNFQIDAHLGLHELYPDIGSRSLRRCKLIPAWTRRSRSFSV